MRIKRYLIILTYLFCALLCGWAQTNVYVQLVTDDILYYRLNDSPTIAYKNNELTIQTTYNFSKSIPVVAIKKILYNPLFITNIADNLLINGPISIFNIFGHHITTIENLEDVEKLNVPFGIYILQSKNISKKIFVK